MYHVYLASGRQSNSRYVSSLSFKHSFVLIQYKKHITSKMLSCQMRSYLHGRIKTEIKLIF